MTKYKGLIGKVVQPKGFLMEEYNITIKDKVYFILSESGRFDDMDACVVEVLAQTIVDLFFNISQHVPEFIIYESHLDEAVSYLKSELEKI